MIETFRAAIASGATTSRALVESCLERAAAASGEGSRTFVHLFADAARAEADAIDGRHRAGIWTGVLGGVPVSVKDLFDIRGLPTTAGSTVLTDAPAATQDATVVERLRAAGAVILPCPDWVSIPIMELRQIPTTFRRGVFRAARPRVRRFPFAMKWQSPRSAQIPADPFAFRPLFAV